jgi:hypothetical protein
MSNKTRQRASLVLNLVLIVTVVGLIRYPAEPAAAPAVAGLAAAQSAAMPSARSAEFYPEAAPARERRRWLVDELRAMGVPNNVLARIVLADLDWAWNKRGGEVSLRTHGDPDTLALLKLENAMSLDAEMRAALGEAGFKEWDHGNMLREANRGKIPFSAAETAGTYSLWKKLQTRELALKKARVKAEMDEVQLDEEYGKAIAEFEREMKGLLGEERYAQARRMDPGSVAGETRQEWAKANPSDAQFQELVKTQQRWNDLRLEIDQLFKDDPSSTAYAEQIKALNDARDHEYRRVLGANAFDTLQKEQHPSYAMMRKNATIWGLDEHKIDSVYATMKFYEKTVQDYKDQARALEAQGQSVDWNGLSRNLAQFSDQTELVLQNYLGRESFAKMRRNGVFPFNGNELPSGSPIRPADRASGG